MVHVPCDGALDAFAAWTQRADRVTYRTVSGDLLIYYEEGNPRVSIVPDVFVVFGVEDRKRPNHKLWEERRAPDFVLEVASPSTWRDDLTRKRSVYARLGVLEYCQHDPKGEHLPARLLGWRLTPSGYVRQPVETAPGGRSTLPSRTLGSGVAGGTGTGDALPRPRDRPRPEQLRRGG